jgi:Zn-dependent peptidase ImmA (M78 family)
VEELAVSRGTIAAVRDLVPIRPLTRHEALSIAERQAFRFLDLTGISDAPVPEHIISELPRLQVERVTPFPSSGAANWVAGRWVVVLNGAEPATRQRFSLAHELKHIFDDPFVDRLYGAVDPRDRANWIEQVCDFFAGCLLMPRPWLKRAWSEEQHIPTLASRFHVSPSAMSTRLHQIGLVRSAARCSRPFERHAPRHRTSQSRVVEYRRLAAPNTKQEHEPCATHLIGSPSG